MLRKTVHIYGYSADTDYGAGDVWGAGGAYTWPTSAITTSIISDDDSDHSAGAGALTVFIEGLDTAGAIISETATMTGTDSVSLTNAYFRINDAEVKTAGTNGTNKGNITIGSTDVTTIAYIPASEGKSQSALYTISAAYTDAKLMGWYCSHYDSAGYQTVRLQVRPSGGAWVTLDKVLIGPNGTNAWIQIYDHPIYIAPMTDIRLRTDASTNDGIVWGGFDLELRD